MPDRTLSPDAQYALWRYAKDLLTEEEQIGQALLLLEDPARALPDKDEPKSIYHLYTLLSEKGQCETSLLMIKACLTHIETCVSHAYGADLLPAHYAQRFEAARRAFDISPYALFASPRKPTLFQCIDELRTACYHDKVPSPQGILDETLAAWRHEHFPLGSAIRLHDIALALAKGLVQDPRLRLGHVKGGPVLALFRHQLIARLREEFPWA